MADDRLAAHLGLTGTRKGLIQGILNPFDGCCGPCAKG
jgi:hypothetical protein